MNDQNTLITHFHAFKVFLDDPDHDIEQFAKQFPRTFNALKTDDPLSFDLPETKEIPELEYPIKLDYAVHGDKFTEDDRFHELVEEGYDEDWLATHFRYLIYELEMELELHENGKVFITKIGPREIIPPILAT